jgi:hypothetical protein
MDVSIPLGPCDGFAICFKEIVFAVSVLFLKKDLLYSALSRLALSDEKKS